MSSQSDQEIEGIYMDYLHEAQRIFKEQQRIYLPYMIVALLLFVASGASCYAGLSLMISPRTGSWLYWICLIAAILVGIVGAIKARNYSKQAASHGAGSKPGFEQFYRLYYNRRWWPNQMVAGKKYDKFLEIIGREATT